jgi:hypothetical protein
MKLIDVKPIIFESLADDTFADPNLPENVAELIRALRRKLAGKQHLRWALDEEADDLLERLVGAQDSWKVPERRRNADYKSGKAFEYDSTYIPNTPGNHAIVQRATAQRERAEKVSAGTGGLQTEITRILKLEAIRRTSTRQKGKISKQIPESKVPEKISSGKGKFGNPYFVSPDKRYAGDPAFFPFSSPMLIMYYELDEILTTNGFEGLTTMYASSIVHGNKNLNNFVVIGAKGKFMWRKYDMGGGSGQNWVYVNGDKMHTSIFLDEARSNTTKFSNWMATLK